MICVFFVVTPKFQPKYLLKYSVFQKFLWKVSLVHAPSDASFSLSVCNMVLGTFITHQRLHFLSHNKNISQFSICQSVFVHCLFKIFLHHILYKSLFSCFISVSHVMCIFQFLNLMTI